MSVALWLNFTRRVSCSANVDSSKECASHGPIWVMIMGHTLPSLGLNYSVIPCWMALWVGTKHRAPPIHLPRPLLLPNTIPNDTWVTDPRRALPLLSKEACMLCLLCWGLCISCQAAEGKKPPRWVRSVWSLHGRSLAIGFSLSPSP